MVGGWNELETKEIRGYRYHCQRHWIWSVFVGPSSSLVCHTFSEVCSFQSGRYIAAKYRQINNFGQMSGISTVSRGTAFEKRSLYLLQKFFSMSLSRVGGAFDGGVDLQGWWWLPALSPPHSHNASPLVQDSCPSNAGPAHRRLRVLAQCKAHAKKTGPNAVREMEGVLYQYRVRSGDSLPSVCDTEDPHVENNGWENAVALLISQSPFTRQTILRTMSSTVPFLLLHLPECAPFTDISHLPISEDQTGDRNIGTAVWNAALAGPQGPLGGEYEVRWVRSPTDVASGIVGHPSLWRNGQPLGNLVPPSMVTKQ